MKKSVCMITGVGEGTGGHTAKVFGKAGYIVAMVARSEERLKDLRKKSLTLEGMYAMFQMLKS